LDTREAAVAELLLTAIDGGSLFVTETSFNSTWVSGGGTIDTERYRAAIAFLHAAPAAVPDGMGGTVDVISLDVFWWTFASADIADATSTVCPFRYLLALPS
jgi:hypothetical protein